MQSNSAQALFSMFDTISVLASDKPHNPMINAGAIVIASLVKNNLRLADRFDHVSWVMVYR